MQKLAPCSYSVEVHHGLVWKRHIDHLLKLRDEEKDRQYFLKELKDLEEEEEDIFMPFTGNSLPERNLPSRVRQENIRRYSQRERQPPNRFTPYIPH